jgi:hypothetical protein
VEAKEGVRVEPENVTYATITLQNYFRMYEKLAGMTGTALTEAEEFSKIYKLDVLPIPTNLEYVAAQTNSTLKAVETKDRQGYKYIYYARSMMIPMGSVSLLEAAGLSGCGLPHSRSQAARHHPGNYPLLRAWTSAVDRDYLSGTFGTALRTAAGRACTAPAPGPAYSPGLDGPEQNGHDYLSGPRAAAPEQSR